MPQPHKNTAEQKDISRARQGRSASLVIAGAMVFWMGAQALGANGLITTRFMFLIDLAAMAAMIWAVWVALRLWLSRKG